MLSVPCRFDFNLLDLKRIVQFSVADSFHAILKKEEVNHVTYIDYKSAKLALFTYIEGWYNRKRIHGGLGYKTPQAVEDLLRNAS
ncbi:IS3 family transposase [Brevibacterium sp. JNUCC-42]|nr:IS3 family transposase [Brevibacterium sp. JNUCC-42]